MIQFQISTDVLTYCMHRSRCPYTDKESGKSNPGDQSLLRSDACGSSLPVREEASQQDHLTNADHQKYNGLADGPECNTSVEVLRPTASLCLTKAEVSLVVDDRLQGLMNRHASRFHLENVFRRKEEGQDIRYFEILKMNTFMLMRRFGINWV